MRGGSRATTLDSAAGNLDGAAGEVGGGDAQVEWRIRIVRWRALAIELFRRNRARHGGNLEFPAGFRAFW
jgi:hypothetical protein